MAKQVLESSSWHNQIESINGNKINIKLDRNNISELNKYLVDNDIKVEALIPIRSLEDYFLSITKSAN